LAPSACPSTDKVETEISKLLGGPARERVRSELSVRATVEHGSQWLVTLDTTSKTSDGHRTIEAGTCEGLANATALIVALMIDPDAVAAHSNQAKEKPPAPPPPLPPTPQPPSPSVPRSTRVLVGIGVTGNLGVLPTADAGVAAGVGVANSAWRVELRAAYGPRHVESQTLANPLRAYGRFSFMAGTLAGCWTISSSVVVYGPCADVEFGVLRGEGVGDLKTTSDSSFWLGLGAGGLLSFKVNHWISFPLHAEVIVPLWRHNFVFQPGESSIFRAWPVGGRLTAGVEMHF
jgi:hypothetical protein